MVEQGNPAKAEARPAAGAGLLQTFRAVLWSFFGVRRRVGYEQDAAQLNPVHVILAGIVAAALFVLALVMVVRIVVS